MATKILTEERQPSGPIAQARIVEVTQGQVITLDEDAQSATYGRDANDLVITSNSTSTVYKGFFAQGEGNPLPILILPDGSEVSGQDFLQSMNPDMDITTAAGPSSVSSSGAGDYGDNANELLGGVDRLGAMSSDSFQWTRGVTRLGIPDASLETADLASLGVPTGPGEIITPPDPSDSLLHANALIGQANGPVYVGVTDADGNSVAKGNYTIEYEFKDGDSSYYVIKGFNPETGLLEIELTDKGKTALADEKLPKETLTVTVDGESYELYLSGSNNNEHADTRDPDFDTMLSEWYVVNGALKDATVDVSSHDGEKQHIRIEGTETNEMNHGVDTQTIYNEETGEDKDEFIPETQVNGIFGVSNSTINAGSKGTVTIAASNQTNEPGDTYVTGIYGSADGSTTIKAGDVHISGTVDSSLSNFTIDDETGEESGFDSIFGYGIKGNGSDIDIKANNITIQGNALITDSEEWYGEFLSAGVSVGGWPGDDDNGAGFGNLKIQGTKIAIEGSTKITGDSYPCSSIGAEAIYGGSLSLLTGDEGGVISIMASIEGGAGNNGDVLEGLVIKGEEMDGIPASSVFIEGGIGFDSLSIVTENKNPNGTLTDYYAVGIENSGTLKVQGIEKIDIRNDSLVTDASQGAGVYSYRGDTNFSNTNDMDLSITGYATGINVSDGASVTAEARNLTVNIDASDVGIEVGQGYTNWNVDPKKYVPSMATIKATGELELTVTGDNAAVENSGILDITGGSGNDTITFDGNVRTDGSYSASPITTIETNGGDDVIKINGNVETYSDQEYGGITTISTGDGRDTVTINGWLRGEGKVDWKVGSTTTIDLGIGDDTLTIREGIDAGYRDSSSDAPHTIVINLGEGSDTLEVGDIVGGVLIKAGDGENDIDILRYKPVGDERLQSVALQALVDAFDPDGMSKIEGFEKIIIDLSESSSADAFNLDLISQLPKGIELVIEGGSDDHYMTDSSWTAGEAVEGYITYTKDGVKIHVQETLTHTELISTAQETTPQDDNIHIEGSYTGNINLKEGDDTLKIDGDLVKGSSVHTGTGSDTVNVLGALSGSTITAEGSAKITVGRGMVDSAIRTAGGNDVIKVTGPASGATISTGKGNDIIEMNANGAKLESVKITGGIGADTVTINGSLVEGRNTITLGSGNANTDILNASGGIDSLVVHGDLKATIIGDYHDANHITVTGDLNAGILYDSAGVRLGNGDDKVTIQGTFHGDINAGAGTNEITIGSTSYGSIITGSGNDTITVKGTSNSRIDAGEGNNVIHLGGDSSGSITTGAGDDEITVKGRSVSSIRAGDGENHITIDNLLAGNIESGVGNDTLTLHKVTDYNNWSYNHIITGAGDDTITITEMNTSFDTRLIDAGEGKNFIDIETLNGFVTINSTEGNDTIKIGMGAGDDSITLQGPVEKLAITDDGGNDELRYIVGEHQATDIENFLAFLGSESAEISGVEKMVFDLNSSSTTQGNVINLDLFSGSGGIDDMFDKIYINGRENDIIDTTGWTKTGDVESLNGMQYDVYSYGTGDDAMEVFIQQLITTG